MVSASECLRQNINGFVVVGDGCKGMNWIRRGNGSSDGGKRVEFGKLEKMKGFSFLSVPSSSPKGLYSNLALLFDSCIPRINQEEKIQSRTDVNAMAVFSFYLLVCTDIWLLSHAIFNNKLNTVFF